MADMFSSSNGCKKDLSTSKGKRKNLHRPLNQRLSQKDSDKTMVLNDYGRMTQKIDGCEVESQLDQGD